jgi:plasmid stability protein
MSGALGCRLYRHTGATPSERTRIASLTIRDLPEDIELALKRRAPQTGRSAADEALTILTRETRVEKRFGLGSLLADIGREAGNEGDGFREMRDKSPSRSAIFVSMITEEQ